MIDQLQEHFADHFAHMAGRLMNCRQRRSDVAGQQNIIISRNAHVMSDAQPALLCLSDGANSQQIIDSHDGGWRHRSIQ